MFSLLTSCLCVRRALKDRDSKLNALKRSQQTDKTRSAQMMDEARRREGDLGREASKAQVSQPVCFFFCCLFLFFVRWHVAIPKRALRCVTNEILPRGAGIVQTICSAGLRKAGYRKALPVYNFLGLITLDDLRRPCAAAFLRVTARNTFTIS